MLKTLQSLFPSSENTSLEAFFPGMDMAFESIEIIDDQGIVLYVNHALEKQLGYKKEELLGIKSKIAQARYFDAEEYSILWQTIQAGKTWDGRFTNTRKNGETCEEEMRIIPFHDQNKHIRGYMILKLDISEKLNIQQQLQDIAETKHEFIALSYHQLRTPLTTINWYLEMILGGCAGLLNPEQTNFLQKAYGSAQNMVELVNQLLMISRLESNAIVPKEQEIQVASFFDSIAKDLQVYAQPKKCDIVMRISDAFVGPLCKDEELLKTVIKHLMLNSIKYSNKTPVSLYLEEKDQEYLIRMEDRGIGTPRDFYQRIFGPFSRAYIAHNKEGDGTGVGLYLIKLIVQSLEGKIWFASELDKRNVFFVSFPKKSIASSTSYIT